MARQDRRTPKKKDLTKGNVVEVISREGALKGKATLIERKPSRYTTDNLPFALKERTNPTQDSSCSYWSSERWLIEWTEHSYYRVGDRTCAEICYFLKVCAQYPSFSEPDLSNLDTEGRYIFLQEEGVLSVGGEYQTLAVKALKRVVKKFRGEIVVYAHSSYKVKDNFEIHKLGRILDFINTDSTFEEGIANYLQNTDYEDYLILCGRDQVDLPNTIQCNVKRGLRLK